MSEIAMEGDLVGPGVWVTGEDSRVDFILKWLKSALVSKDRLESVILPLLLMLNLAIHPTKAWSNIMTSWCHALWQGGADSESTVWHG